MYSFPVTHQGSSVPQRIETVAQYYQYKFLGTLDGTFHI